MITISKKNEVYLRVEGEQHLHKELSEFFQFEVPGAKYMPQYKRRFWDGKIRLYSPGTGEIYVGLYDYLADYLEEKGYEFTLKDSKFYGLPNEEEDYVTPEGIATFVKHLRLPFKARDYQLKAIFQAIKQRRKLLLSPTGSGKSLIIYGLVRWHRAAQRNILIIVPTTSLVSQLKQDFKDYGWNANANVHEIMAGREKHTEKPVVVSTWQSIYKEKKGFFERFDVVIGDEAHLYKAKSLTGILAKCHDIKYRVGLEIDYLITHPKRNNFICNLAIDVSGNTLILFNYVEKHGEPLWDMLNSKVQEGTKVFFIHGGVDAVAREEARKICEKETNAIILASYGTFSTGINIRNLHNVIFASPSKSRVRNLQSIGRVLRKGDNKAQAMLYDIADDCSKGQSYNYTFRHLIERMKIYDEEKFDYEVTKVSFKK